MSSSATSSCMRASAAGLVCAVTGTWWNVTPYEAASDSNVVWFDTMAGISMGSAPTLCR